MPKIPNQEKGDTTPEEDQLNKCTKCDSQEIEDTPDGLSCTSCGFILEDSFVYDLGYGKFVEDEDKQSGQIESRTNFHLNTEAPSTNGQFKVSKTVDSLVGSKVFYDNSKIKEICQQLHLGREIEQQSQEIFRFLGEKSVRSTKIEYLCAVVYCASRFTQNVRTPEDFCREFSITTTKLTPFIQKINLLFSQNEKLPENVVETQKTNFVRKCACSLALDSRLIEKIVKTCTIISNNHPSTKSKTIACISIYYELKKSNLNDFTMKTLTKVCGVSEPAVYKFKKELENSNELKF